MLRLLNGPLLSSSSIPCVVGQHRDDDLVVRFVSCAFDVVVSVLEFVSYVCLDVVSWFCCVVSVVVLVVVVDIVNGVGDVLVRNVSQIRVDKKVECRSGVIRGGVIRSSDVRGRDV